MKSTYFDNGKVPLFMKPGHCAGDLVEASKWTILREEAGLVEINAQLPERLLNPRRQLFGGFTGTYVDMMAIYTVRTLYIDKPGFAWTSTINMHIDYLEPVLGPDIKLRGELIKDGNSTCLVAVHIMDSSGNKLVYAICTMKKHTQIGS